MDKLAAIQLILNAKGSFLVYTGENNGTVIHSPIAFEEVDLLTEWLNMKMLQQQQNGAVMAANKIINGKA